MTFMLRKFYDFVFVFLEKSPEIEISIKIKCVENNFNGLIEIFTIYMFQEL